MQIINIGGNSSSAPINHPVVDYFTITVTDYWNQITFSIYKCTHIKEMWSTTVLITSHFFFTFLFMFVRFYCSTSSVPLLSHCGGIIPWRLDKKMGTMRFTIYGTHWWGIRSKKNRDCVPVTTHISFIMLVYVADGSAKLARKACQAHTKKRPGS